MELQGAGQSGGMFRKGTFLNHTETDIKSNMNPQNLLASGRTALAFQKPSFVKWDFAVNGWCFKTFPAYVRCRFQ